MDGMPKFDTHPDMDALLAAKAAVSQGADAATLVATPASHDFGPVPIGEALTQTIELGNSGQVPIELLSLSLVGTGPGYSPASPPAPGTLIPPAGTADVVVRFAPAVAGAAAGALEVVHDGGNSPLSIPLGGVGLADYVRAEPPPGSCASATTWENTPAAIRSFSFTLQG